MAGADSREQPRRSSSSRKPASQEHWKEPARLVQWWSQPPRSDAHSSTSAGRGAAGACPQGQAREAPAAPLCPRARGPVTPPPQPSSRPRLRVMVDSLPEGGWAGSGLGWGPCPLRGTGDPRLGGPVGRSEQPCRLQGPGQSPEAKRGPPGLTLTRAAVGAEPVAGVAATLVAAGAVGAGLLAAGRGGTVVHVCGDTWEPAAPQHPQWARLLTRTPTGTHRTHAPAAGPPQLWGPDRGWGC